MTSLAVVNRVVGAKSSDVVSYTPVVLSGSREVTISVSFSVVSGSVPAALVVTSSSVVSSSLSSVVVDTVVSIFVVVSGPSRVPASIVVTTSVLVETIGADPAI